MNFEKLAGEIGFEKKEYLELIEFFCKRSCYKL